MARLTEVKCSYSCSFFCCAVEADWDIFAFNLSISLDCSSSFDDCTSRGRHNTVGQCLSSSFDMFGFAYR